jgi:hypothetical protein
VLVIVRRSSSASPEPAPATEPLSAELDQGM